MKRSALLLAALLLALSLSACAPERNAVKNSVDDVKDAVEDSVDDAKNTVDNGLKDAEDDLEDMVEDGKVHDSDGDLTDGENPRSKR